MYDYNDNSTDEIIMDEGNSVFFKAFGVTAVVILTAVATILVVIVVLKFMGQTTIGGVNILSIFSPLTTFEKQINPDKSQNFSNPVVQHTVTTKPAPVYKPRPRVKKPVKKIKYLVFLKNGNVLVSTSVSQQNGVLTINQGSMSTVLNSHQINKIQKQVTTNNKTTVTPWTP